jgi:O-antigen/teichoic acid export membrane protein
MLKSLFRDSMLYTVAIVLTRGLSFLLLPVYTRVLSPEEFGLLDYFVALGAIASIVVTLEIVQGFARHISEYLDDAEKKKDFASTCMWFVVGSYTALLFLLIVFSSPLASFLLDSSDKSDLIKLVAWAYWVAGVFNVILNQLRWEIRPVASVILSLVAGLLTVGFTFLFVVWLEWGVKGALLGQIIGGLLSLLPGYYLIRHSFGLRFSLLNLRQMLAFSAPLIPSSLGVVFATYFDRIALKELMALSDLGIYAVAQKISLLITLIMIGFRSALTPLIYVNYKLDASPDDLAKVFNLFCFSAMVLILVISIFANEIVNIMAAAAFQDAAKVIPILMFSALLANMYIFAPGLDIYKKTGIISLINSTVALLGLVLNYSLIPFFGIIGAAVSSLLAFGISFIAYVIFSQRLYPVPHNWTLVLKLISITVLAIYFVNVLDYVWYIHLIIKTFILIFTLFLLMRIMGLISFNLLKNFLHR